MSSIEIKKLDELLSKAQRRFEELSGGRSYDVGVQVLYNGKLGIITDLNKDSQDVAGSTVDIRMSDGTVHAAVNVKSTSLKRYRG